MPRKWVCIFIDIFKELVTVSMGITFLVGRVTRCNELWTPDVVVNMEATAHSLQIKPGRLLMDVLRSRRLQKMLKDVRKTNLKNVDTY
jgi:hypothetical protein